jgi:hypothetical protein
VLFDLGLANELYAALIGPVEEATKQAPHLLVVPSGPTLLPFHLLVAAKPATAIPHLKDIGSDAAWAALSWSQYRLPVFLLSGGTYLLSRPIKIQTAPQRLHSKYACEGRRLLTPLLTTSYRVVSNGKRWIRWPCLMPSGSVSISSG